MPLGIDIALALAAGALHTLPFVFTQAWALQLALVARLGLGKLGSHVPA